MIFLLNFDLDFDLESKKKTRKKLQISLLKHCGQRKSKSKNKVIVAHLMNFEKAYVYRW